MPNRLSVNSSYLLGEWENRMEDAFFGGAAILETEKQRASIKLLDKKGLHFLLLVSSIFF